MRPGEYTLRIYQGSPLDVVMTWTADDVAVPMAGWTGRLQVRTGPGGTLLLDLSTETPGVGDTWIEAITLHATNGTITIHVDGADTEDLDWRSARFDLELDSGSGDGPDTILAGPAILTRQITEA